MIRQQHSRMHCGHGAWRAQRYVAFCLNARAGVKVMTTSWTKECSFYKIKPLLIGLLQRKVYHRVCKSVIYNNEKNEPHLFPYSRVMVHFIACYGYNVDRWSFRQKMEFPAKKPGLMEFIQFGDLDHHADCPIRIWPLLNKRWKQVDFNEISG